MTPTPTIFLSYCWKDIDHANTIDNDFKSIGITFRRDQRNLEYRQSIKEFMQTIGKHDFVVMLISNAYLRSANCMYEVTELLNSHEFNKKILPVLLPDASGIFNKAQRLIYYKHWEMERSEAQGRLQEISNEDHLQQVKECNNIIEHLDKFFTTVTDMNISGIEKLKASGYDPLLKLIGIQNPKRLERILRVSNLENKEHQELELEDFLACYPLDQYGLFLKAWLADECGKYIKAKKYYNDLLSEYPRFAPVHYNLSILLAERFEDFEGAKKHYLLAIDSDPKMASAHNNLANLLNNQFEDYEEARKHYLLAIEADPQMADAHYNLGNILKNKFDDFVKAKEHYLLAIESAPKMADAHYHLANLLRDQFKDFQGALKHYLSAIETNPEMGGAHYNLGTLLLKEFDDPERAKEHYLLAIQADPKDFAAHFNLAVLYINNFDDTENCKKHYLISTQLNEKLIDNEIDLIFQIVR